MKFVRAAVVFVGILAFGMFGLSVAKDVLSRDGTMPEITSDREVLELSCDYSQEQLLEGLSAYDAKDGDLTDQILAGNMMRFIEKGVCSITYVVFDADNNSASLTRRICFTDYESPRFSVSQPLVYTEGTGSYQETMGRIGVTDKLDGDLKEFLVQKENNVAYGRAGDYRMVFEVSNSFGDSVTVSLPVHIVSEAAQMVNIRLKQGLVYLNNGEEINPEDYIEEVTDRSGNSLDRQIVSVSSGVDAHTSGTYEIHYTAQDENGDTGETWLTVIVTEQE